MQHAFLNVALLQLPPLKWIDEVRITSVQVESVAGVAKLEHARDLGSRGVTLGGSSPSARTSLLWDTKHSSRIPRILVGEEVIEVIDES